jgi:hemoglobin
MTLAPKPDGMALVRQGTVTFSFRDIETVVSRFYGRVQLDPMLSVPFQSVRDWPFHLERLTHFWWVRLGGAPYLNERYNPPQKHLEAGFNKPLLEKWLEVFQLTLEETLSREQAAEWSNIAQRMGHALSLKNEALLKEFQRG